MYPTPKRRLLPSARHSHGPKGYPAVRILSIIINDEDSDDVGQLGSNRKSQNNPRALAVFAVPYLDRAVLGLYNSAGDSEA